MKITPPNNNPEMETLLAVMLYLHLIIAPGVYESNVIMDLEQVHSIEIQSVTQDPIKLKEAEILCRPLASGIIIINETEMD